MAKKKKIQKKRISNVEILLRNHTKGELSELYIKLFNEKPNNKLTATNLSSYIAEMCTEQRILQNWGKKFGVYNTSVTVYCILNDKRVRQKKLLDSVKVNVGTESWKELFKSKKPINLDTPKLLEVKEVNNVMYFLVAEKGRTRTVLNGFTYQEIVEPRFSIVVWDDSKGIIQVRGSGNHSRSLKLVVRALKLSSQYDYLRCHIDNNKDLKIFAKALGGKVTQVKLLDDGSSTLSYAEMGAKPTKSVLNSSEYKYLKSKGFEDSAGGVSFKNGTEGIVLWIGFTAKTIWLRQGALDEDVLNKVVTEFLKHGTIE